MLALAFSEVSVDFRTIRNAVQRETVAISDTFEVLKMFDIEKTREIRTILVEYTQAVINDGWPALANDELGQRTGDLKMQLREAVMNSDPFQGDISVAPTAFEYLVETLQSEIR
jgi:LytS/YehU family sensor histidine kinase